MPQASHQQDFGPVPVVPGGLATGEVAVVDNCPIHLLEGLSQAASIQSVTLTFGALVIDYDGAGEDTVRIYVSDPQTDPRTTAPILSLPIVLSPGQTDTLLTDIAADSRVMDLFSQKQMNMTVTTSLRGPSSGNPLSGRFQLNAFDAVVIAGSKGF